MQKTTKPLSIVYGFMAGLVLGTIGSQPTWGQTTTSYNANNIPIVGNFSVGIGIEALKVNAGGNNTAIGYRALFSNTTGDHNTANGAFALFSNTTGLANNAIGYRALFSNTTGNENTANGNSALFSNTTGHENTANGDQALFSNTTGSGNTANGSFALVKNTTGSGNTANGGDALHNNITGFGNTAIGYFALEENTTGNQNTANGESALEQNTTGSNNTANGARALRFNSTGFGNIANGSFALYRNQIGSHNTALGDSAGYESLGSGNIYIGHKAGAMETGSNKLYIGNNNSKNNSNRTILYGDIGTGQVLLGKPDATGYTFKGTRTLNVLGGILADSVRVALSGLWADYVFDGDYPLLALEALALYIKNNKHLPGIPTQEQVEKEGIHLADMNTKLLEKIEELTLYMLKQQEQMVESQQEIDDLKEITTKQMALIHALEKKINK